MRRVTFLIEDELFKKAKIKAKKIEERTIRKNL